MRIVTGLLTAAVIGDVIVAIIAAIFLWPLRKTVPLAKVMGLLYTGIAVDHVCRMIAMSQTIPGAKYWGYGGRVAISIGVYVSVLELIRYRSGNKA